MTDPVVGRLTFTGVIGGEPSTEELASVVSHYLMRLPEEVAQSSGYHVLEGVEELLLSLCRNGFLLGITTGAVEAAAHIKLARAGLNRFFSFGGYGSDSADRGELTRKAIDRAGVVLGSPLDPPRVLVLGDTPKDVAAAHSANAIAVGVAAYGRTARDRRGGSVTCSSRYTDQLSVQERSPAISKVRRRTRSRCRRWRSTPGEPGSVSG